MASDYQGADSVKAFAERRGITFRERVADMVRKVPEKVRSIFANFRPPDRQLSVAGRDEVRTRHQKREVERYARAAVGLAPKIGRAACRESVCQYVSISGVAV